MGSDVAVGRRASSMSLNFWLVSTELHAQGVVNSDVGVILSELDTDVSQASIHFQWNVWANFLLENLNVSLNGCGVKEPWLNNENWFHFSLLN